MDVCQICANFRSVRLRGMEKRIPCPACACQRVLQPANGMSDEAFRDHAIIAIYAAMAGKFPRARWEWAARRSVDMVDALLAERNRRRDERQKGGK